jgi:pyroglutamyl-peptidase
MPTVLLTAFEPYDSWTENSSWLTLMELAQQLPATPRITTRRYPVEIGELRRRLSTDLAANYDYVLHLGQAPGSAGVQLEAIGINLLGGATAWQGEAEPLEVDGPLAYRSRLPLVTWATKLRQAGIPSCVSYHAGTYLCNAALYLTHRLAEQQQLKTRCALLHLPLETSQTLHGNPNQPSLPRAQLARAVRLILEELATEPTNSAAGEVPA